MIVIPPWSKNTEKSIFGDFYLVNLLFYSKHCFMGQGMVSSYPMILTMVPVRLMTRPLHYYPQNLMISIYIMKSCGKSTHVQYYWIMNDSFQYQLIYQNFFSRMNHWSLFILLQLLLHCQSNVEIKTLYGGALQICNKYDRVFILTFTILRMNNDKTTLLWILHIFN